MGSSVLDYYMDTGVRPDLFMGVAEGEGEGEGEREGEGVGVGDGEEETAVFVNCILLRTLVWRGVV